MRYTRFQLSRLFLNFAIAILPDGVPKPFVAMLKAHTAVMEEIDDMNKERQT